MIISGVTQGEIYKALDRANQQFNGNLSFNRAPERVGRRYRCTIRVADSKGPGAKRNPITGRRIASACWHAHGVFFDSLPSTATVRALDRVIRPGDLWWDRDEGSMMYPFRASEACECLGAW